VYLELKGLSKHKIAVSSVLELEFMSRRSLLGFKRDLVSSEKSGLKVGEIM
jgi:hypothetical protein